MNEPVSPDTREERLDELLETWEQSVACGSPPSLADLCRDCPDLAADVERKIRRLRAIDRFMFPNSNDPVDTPHSDAISSDFCLKFPLHSPGYEILEELGKGVHGSRLLGRDN